VIGFRNSTRKEVKQRDKRCKAKLEQAGSLIRYLRPDFLNEIAEAVEAEDV
jgi:hypothetical protein